MKCPMSEPRSLPSVQAIGESGSIKVVGPACLPYVLSQGTCCAGEAIPIPRGYLCEPERFSSLSIASCRRRSRPSPICLHISTRELFAMIFVANLHLDIGSHTVLADAWVPPGTMAVQEKLGHLKIIFDIVTIKIDPDESEAWRYLLPLLIERCRTWTHQPSCEYLTRGTIPLSPDAGADPEKSPFCSCGVGVGTETFPQRFKSLAPYVTRMAISPLFAVPYLEKVGMMSEAPKDQGGCKACGKQGGSLSLCGKCKTVRYCSKECQVKDWKAHKKTASGSILYLQITGPILRSRISSEESIYVPITSLNPADCITAAN